MIISNTVKKMCRIQLVLPGGGKVGGGIDGGGRDGGGKAGGAR